MKISRPRYGSLQFWPRKRAEKLLPSVNWKPVNGEGILGFIGYKVGMATALVRDNTPDSMTKGKRMALPVTILETPNMKIYSVRFYKHGKVMKDVVVSNDKILAKKVKVGKVVGNVDHVQGYDDVRIVVYSLPPTSVKKNPDMIEIAIGGKDKIGIVKGLIGKEIGFKDFIKGKLVDVRGLTKGKGLTGPVDRFGLSLKQHKSEKGRRRPGSLGPWHPARVTFRVPISGQMGMFTRVHYNLKVLHSANIVESNINKDQGWKHYGKIVGNYLILAGSVQGPPKRQVLLTSPLRASKKQLKANYEFREIAK